MDAIDQILLDRLTADLTDRVFTACKVDKLPTEIVLAALCSAMLTVCTKMDYPYEEMAMRVLGAAKEMADETKTRS